MKSFPMTKVAVSFALAASSVTSAVLLSGHAAQAAASCDPSLVAKASSTININFEESMPGGAVGGSGNHGVLVGLIDAYNASQNKVHVTDVNDTGDYTTTWTKYTADLANNGAGAPNVVMFDQYDSQGAADTKSIIPVDSCIAADAAFKKTQKNFVQKALSAYVVSGTQVGMPFSVSTPVMYYNLQAFKKAKIAKAPATMADLIADQALLQKAGYKYGVAIKKDPWYTMAWLSVNDLPFVNNGNGHNARATATNFNNSTSQQYWSDVQTIIKNGGLASSLTGSITQAYANIFAIAQDTAGITFDTTAALGSISAALPLFKNVTLGVAPLPTLTGSAAGSMLPAGNGLFIPKYGTAAQTAAAWDFIKFLTSASSMATWASSTGYLPIRTDSQAAWTKALGKTQIAWYQVAFTQFAKGLNDNNTQGPVIPDYEQVLSDFGPTLDALTQSPWKSASSELAKVQDQTTADIQSYNSSLGY
jgi:sn-glycerol 3-phosphate transport system substrate-binding protein